jgi:hypothetical protein
VHESREHDVGVRIGASEGDRNPSCHRRHTVEDRAPTATIACSNIVGLLLVRALARRRESAVRSALGASRWRIARLWLTESLLLAGAGLVGGLLLAWWGTRALVALAPESTPQLDRITLTWPVTVFAIVICLASAMTYIEACTVRVVRPSACTSCPMMRTTTACLNAQSPVSASA